MQGPSPAAALSQACHRLFSGPRWATRLRESREGHTEGLWGLRASLRFGCQTESEDKIKSLPCQGGVPGPRAASRASLLGRHLAAPTRQGRSGPLDSLVGHRVSGLVRSLQIFRQTMISRHVKCHDSLSALPSGAGC